jgi:hypothetical protein
MYGIYLNNISRFLLISNDLWMLMHTANLLSSKFTLCVCLISKEIKINNSNCLTWTLEDPSMAISDRQIPRLKIVNDKLKDTGVIIENEGWVKSQGLDTISVISEYQEFAKFVLAVTQSARMTDALLNASNQTYFLNLLDSTENIISLKDDTNLPGGFLYSIDKILYLANSKEDALSKMSMLIPDNADRLLTEYKKTFLSFYNQS